MSSSGTDAGRASWTETHVPNLNFIIHPQLNSLMISHTFLILLIPLIVSLFHFSTPQSRRRLIFLLNVAAISLAFIVGVMINVSTIHTILEPLRQLPLNFSVAIGSLGVWQSILVDLILLVRLISVYPPRQIGLIRFSLIIAIPVFLKVARVMNIILFVAAAAEAADGPIPSLMTYIVFYTKPYLKIEWATQMLDNTYVSLVFLWTIRGRGGKHVTDPSNSVTWSERMRTLFRIGVTNFVIPTMFSIAQFISVYHEIDEVVLEQLVLVNMMLATFGVAFATVWAGNFNRQEALRLESKLQTSSHPMPLFAVGPSAHSNEEKSGA